VTDTAEAIIDMSLMMALTCSMACVASAAAGLNGADSARRSLRGFAGLASQRFDFRGDNRKAASGVAARAPRSCIKREQIGLPGDRLNQAITSPIRVAAPASSVMVVAVRRASETARLATSVDLVAWLAISHDGGSQFSTELAAALHFATPR